MSDSISHDDFSTNGWAAVSRSFTKSLTNVDKARQAELSVQHIRLPTSDIARKTYKFAKEQLPEKTFNHSMRVVFYGQ